MKTDPKIHTEMLIAVLGLNPEKVFWLQVDTALEYLDQEYPDIKPYLMRMPSFWIWWIEQIWTQQDKALLSCIKEHNGRVAHNGNKIKIGGNWNFYKSKHRVVPVNPPEPITQKAINTFLEDRAKATNPKTITANATSNQH